MYDFGTDWAEEIAQVSTLPEFQNASVVIFVPSHGEDQEYDVETGEWSGGYGPVKLYEGRARVVGVRSRSLSEDNYNPTALKNARLQVPREGITGRVPNNAKAYFTDGGRNPQLASYLFNLNSDLNSSHVAAYTFELTVDMDIRDFEVPDFPEGFGKGRFGNVPFGGEN